MDVEIRVRCFDGFGVDSHALHLFPLSDFFASGLYIEILKIFARGPMHVFVEACAERDLQEVFDCTVPFIEHDLEGIGLNAASLLLYVNLSCQYTGVVPRRCQHQSSGQTTSSMQMLLQPFKQLMELVNIYNGSGLMTLQLPGTSDDFDTAR